MVNKYRPANQIFFTDISNLKNGLTIKLFYYRDSMVHLVLGEILNKIPFDTQSVDKDNFKYD